jgi:hypothetical protein
MSCGSGSDNRSGNGARGVLPTPPAKAIPTPLAHARSSDKASQGAREPLRFGISLDGARICGRFVMSPSGVGFESRQYTNRPRAAQHTAQRLKGNRQSRATPTAEMGFVMSGTTAFLQFLHFISIVQRTQQATRAQNAHELRG